MIKELITRCVNSVILNVKVVEILQTIALNVLMIQEKTLLFVLVSMGTMNQILSLVPSAHLNAVPA